MKNLFVGNLSFQTSESELRSIFEPYGEVARARVITDRDTGRSRGFAFVEMANDDEANRAVEAVNGKEVGGRALTVSEARPKPERTGGGMRDRGQRERTYSRDRDYSRPGQREPRW